MTKIPLNDLIKFEWLFWIIACTTAVFLSPTTHPILFICYFLALPLFAILRSLSDVPILPAKNIALPLAGLLVAILISAVVTPDLSFSLRKICGLLNSIGLFTSLLTSAPSKWNLPAWLLLFFGLVISGVGAIGSDIYARIPILFPFFRLFYRIVPLLPNVQRVINANLIAGALLWALPATVGFLIYARRQNSKLLIALSAAVLFIQSYTLILMQSRAALIAIIIVAFGAIWLAIPKARIMIRNIGIGCTALILFLVLPIWPQSVQENLQEVYFNLLVKGDEGERGLDSLDGRVKIWRRAFEKVNEKPLFGYGLNIFRQVANDPTPVLNPPKEIPHAHNWALQITLELGITGLSFYVWLLAAAFKNSWVNWQSKSSKRPIALGYAAALLGFMIFGLFDTISPGARPDFIFWILMAGAFSIQSD